jgi:hypothetical protein
VIHARSDYNRIQDPEGKIPENEPVFLIRAQDEVGAAAVRAWAHLYRVNGGADPVYLSAMRHAERMEVWPKHKPADVPAEALDTNTGKHQPFEYDPKG